MIYEYIKFVKVEEKPKTSVWSCQNKGDDYELGVVKWYGSWRQYCFFPSGPSVLNKGCLEDIIHFMEAENGKRRN